MCGATGCASTIASKAIGLSPRVWGNQTGAARRCCLLRPIPTCVGQPRPFAYEKHRKRAYPHVCGATILDSAGPSPDFGLSPRVWGNQRRKVRVRLPTRPIPTCVGQPRRNHSRRHARWAYPHVCGATGQDAAGMDVAQGLSPRVWGNLQ